MGRLTGCGVLPEGCDQTRGVRTNLAEVDPLVDDMQSAARGTTDHDRDAGAGEQRRLHPVRRGKRRSGTSRGVTQGVVEPIGELCRRPGVVQPPRVPTDHQPRPGGESGIVFAQPIEDLLNIGNGLLDPLLGCKAPLEGGPCRCSQAERRLATRRHGRQQRRLPAVQRRPVPRRSAAGRGGLPR